MIGKALPTKQLELGTNTRDWREAEVTGPWGEGEDPNSARARSVDPAHRRLAPESYCSRTWGGRDDGPSTPAHARLYYFTKLTKDTDHRCSKHQQHSHMNSGQHRNPAGGPHPPRPAPPKQAPVGEESKERKPTHLEPERQQGREGGRKTLTRRRRVPKTFPVRHLRAMEVLERFSFSRVAGGLGQVIILAQPVYTTRLRGEHADGGRSSTAAESKARTPPSPVK